MDNIDNLERVFFRLQESKLKVNVKKCTFFTTSVKYLGRIISAEGLKPQPNKIEAVNKMSTSSKNNYSKRITVILGVTNYRKFIESYAWMAAPLNKLTKGHKNEKIKNKNKNT
ncbi:POL5 [Enterospora canceri]|uniref:POL5 n=1 Tax=Enterospora canceri TaxID=1081671 RepID=A0A1Y1S4B9_9MICR|nr:POL5 [Enterospora canceri]